MKKVCRIGTVLYCCLVVGLVLILAVLGVWRRTPQNVVADGNLAETAKLAPLPPPPQHPHPVTAKATQIRRTRPPPQSFQKPK